MQFSAMQYMKCNHKTYSENIRTEKQECIPVGCVLSAAVAVCLGGVCQEGICPSGCLPMGGRVARGVRLPPWTEFLTDACENITFPQLRLRTVTNKKDENGFNLSSNHTYIKNCSSVTRGVSKVV